jgi:hypothetical protein
MACIWLFAWLSAELGRPAIFRSLVDSCFLTKAAMSWPVAPPECIDIWAAVDPAGICCCAYAGINVGPKLVAGIMLAAVG